MSRKRACGALGLLLASLLIACAPAGDVVIPAGGGTPPGAETRNAGPASADGIGAAGMQTQAGGQAFAAKSGGSDGSDASRASPEVEASEAHDGPTPTPAEDLRPTAQYATADEFAGDIVRFPFSIDTFPARLADAAKRFGTGITCPELAYSELSEGYIAPITDTVFIHLHTPGGDGIYEISVGEMGALRDKATAHDAFVQAALSVLGAVGDLTQEQAMEVMDALHVSDPAASGKARIALDQNGFRVTMEVRDGVDLRFAVHPVTPREERQP